MESATKVARCHIEAMAVLIRNVAGHNWGWFSQEDQRMHVQTVDKESLYAPRKVKAWLEARGKRVFEQAEGNLTGSEWKAIKAKVEADRGLLESKWSVFAAENGWLKVTLKGSIVTLTAYQGTHNSFSRTLDLKKIFPGAYPSWACEQVKLDLVSSPGLLAVGPEDNPDHRNHLELRKYLFED
jgi:hypothetical protein